MYLAFLILDIYYINKTVLKEPPRSPRWARSYEINQNKEKTIHWIYDDLTPENK